MSTRNYILKVILIGDSGVGKTSLMNTYVNQKFSDEYKATIGADFLTKELVINGSVVTMQIWDTAGQERFQSINVAFYRGADCCIMVYDITDHDSFVHLGDWKEEFMVQSAYENPETFPFVVIGNKIDCDNERLVSRNDVEQWCKQNGNLQFFETSAKESINVDKAFIAVAESALKREQESNIYSQLPENILLPDFEDETTIRQRKSRDGCC
ncbi:rab family [Anaeramoeba ignava]|uniref:Rab family n=1 Tax=Anaeramoeba ignava TaxID=1746090 RepID=A0A9Q0LRQ6_ANAIG|nr:rab family [Anaeramoeba ignava]